MSIRRTRSRAVVAIALAAAASIVLAACGSSSGDSGGGSGTTPGKTAGLEKITVYIPQVLNAPEYLAQEKGLFKKHGLDVTMKIGSSPSAQIPLLLKGQAQIGIAGDTPIAQAVAHGLDVKLILGMASLDTNADVSGGLKALASSHITNMKDLTGKTIALAGLNAAPEFMIRYGIDKQGGDSSKTKFVSIPPPAMIAALDKGTVAAAFLLQPFYNAAPSPKYAPIANPASEKGSPLLGSPAMAFAASDSYISEHADVIKKFQAAMEEAIDMGMKNPDLLRAQLSKHSKLTPEQIKATGFDFNPAIDRDGLAAMVKQMVKYGALDKAPDVGKMVWTGAPQPASGS